MEPTIYNTGAYNTPGVYKGTGGIYNGRGVYNDCENVVNIGGRNYPFVKIGNLFWITENIDYKKPGINIGGPKTFSPNAWYYNNNEDEFGINGRKYGLLYNKAATEIIKNDLTNGWRVPLESDWNYLKMYANNDGSKLKSSNYWISPGNDEYKFNALPSGFFSANQFGGDYNECDFRCDTIYTVDRMITVYIDNNNNFFIGPSSLNDTGTSLRLCKDA